MSLATLEDYSRRQLSCPITLVTGTGQAFFTKTIDVSKHGALVAFPFEDAPAVGEVLDIQLLLPTSVRGQATRTINGQARVVRHQDLGQDGKTGIGLQFLPPLRLATA